ncbi:MAG: glutathione S-transferase N-terminal domain-containing protein [Beijerinckiaceae bacterium]|nr:glutathione S-transferase N-terminal domain-containing protein [Beijerinckiaceae bacterium]
MIELHYWPTSNGQKVAIFLEETALPYEAYPVNIGKGDQFKPDFLKLSPNGKIPAILDRAPADGGAPVSVFESAAILLYLAQKTGKFIPADMRGRVKVTEWLFWQMGGLGPNAGQANHFSRAAPEKIPYAIDRFVKETNRLYGVLDGQLAHSDYIAGEFSIADMCCYPWVVNHEWHQANLDDFPNVKRWYEAIKARPAVKIAYEKAAVIRGAGA